MNADPGVLDPSPTAGNAAAIEKAAIDAALIEKTSSGHAAAESLVDAAAPPELVIPMLLKHALVQGSALLVVFLLWAAADTWYLVTGLALAVVLSVVTAAFAGILVNTVIHEWFHYFGARVSGASFSVPQKYGAFVYDFDYPANTARQFYIMSFGGQFGSVLAITGLLLLLPLDNAGRAMLVAATVGAAVFGAVIEWPVMLRTRHSGNPLQELSKINLQTLQRAAIGGVLAAIVVLLLA